MNVSVLRLAGVRSWKEKDAEITRLKADIEQLIAAIDNRTCLGSSDCFGRCVAGLRCMRLK